MSFNKRNVNGEGNRSEASKELNQELLVPPDHERNTPVVLSGDHFAPRGHLAMSGEIWLSQPWVGLGDGMSLASSG